MVTEEERTTIKTKLNAMTPEERAERRAAWQKMTPQDRVAKKSTWKSTRHVKPNGNVVTTEETTVAQD